MAAVTATLNAVNKGIENTKPQRGVTLIEDWERALADADFRGSKGIARDLQSLHKALDKPEPDEARIRVLLGRLGAATVKAAEGASKGGDKLKQLGEALAKAGHADEDADTD